MNTPPKIRIGIVDDHFLVRVGLRGSLQMEPGFVVAGEGGSGEEAIELCRACTLDVLLLDLRLPGKDGIQTTEILQREMPAVRIIALSTFQGDEDIFRAVQAGAKAYLPKSVQRDELITAIRTVMGGNSYFPASIAAALARRLGRPTLSQREKEVLKLVAEGKTNKEIGVMLSLADATAKLHVDNILNKLGVKDRTEAARVAIQRGIVWVE